MVGGVGEGRGHQSEKQNRKDVESPKVCNSSKTLIKMWQPQLIIPNMESIKGKKNSNF